MANPDHRRLLTESQAALERTSASLARSNQLAIETEYVGSEVSDELMVYKIWYISVDRCYLAIANRYSSLQVLNELGGQRESLLRSQRGLQNTNDGLSKSRVILRSMQKNVFYNKLVLILIILMEIVILAGAVYLKFIK